MALIVEDGTGLVNAESYVSVADYKTYHVNRGIGVAGSDLDIERRLRLATEYIDLRWGGGVQGLKIADTQALVWPSTWFLLPVPTQLVNACNEYAFFLIKNKLFIDDDGVSGGAITRLLKKIGPIMTETAFGLGTANRKNPKVIKADAMMKQVVVGGFSSNGGVIR